MTQLNQLKYPKGSRKNRKRIGRGQASGQGTQAGKGHKGQRARAGSYAFIGFEGGQMPLKRRIPKRGFTNIFRKVYTIVNLMDLETRFEDGAKIDIEALQKVGLIKKNIKVGVKILGKGEITKKFNVSAHQFSSSAKEKILAKGGAVEELASGK